MVDPFFRPAYFTQVPRRVRKSGSLLAPAGSLLKRLSDTSLRYRRRLLRVSLAVLSVAFISSLLFGTYSVPHIIKLHLQRSSLIQANRRLSTELIDAARVIEMLKNDPGYLEQIARSRYYMARKDETIYRFRGR